MFVDAVALIRSVNSVCSQRYNGNCRSASSIHVAVLHTCGSAAMVGWVSRGVCETGILPNITSQQLLAISSIACLEIALKSHKVRVSRNINTVISSRTQAGPMAKDGP